MHAQDRIGNSIAAIVADPILHAKWLNTFSFLEYVGFRKIVKSQRAEALSAAVLNHALEEGRHALGLKKLAVKLGGLSFDSYAPETMLCGEEAEAYFQELDGACDEAFSALPEAERAKLVYCYVTWLIERRALDVYGVYKQALGASEIARKLDGLLAEEIRHLAEVEAWLQAGDPGFPTRSKEFEAVEARLYDTFVEALARDLAQRKPLAAPVPA
ncbi:ferritin-like domain-containing protein [Methylocapsa polymorpha]|uniref:Ferritin-like domain-containing protein n=1 Tax=Methylocapsa polymorpha TaxID=3080828 RepID=A0ABZ0HTZ7_9HYPH|nr:ferritin-like domain-containing protein [Methylocapsa sp. RX1]